MREVPKMMVGYDDEAPRGFQDADFEMAEYQAQAQAAELEREREERKPADGWEVRDPNGELIEVGTRVTVGDDAGEVVGISDPDGDANAAGVPRAIHPTVTVRFGIAAEGFDTSPEMGSWFAPTQVYRCDELEVVR